MMKRHINRAKRVSRQCRNNNWCPYCRGSRLHNARRRLLDAREQVETAIEDWEGEAEMAWTNYGINRCYSSLEWEEL